MLESYEAKIEAGTASKDGTYRERGVFKEYNDAIDAATQVWIV